MSLSEKDVLLLKIKVSKELEDGTLFDDNELILQLNEISDVEYQETIAVIFYNIQSFESLKSLEYINKLQDFINKIDYLKNNRRASTAIDYFFLETKLNLDTEENNIEFFNNYKIKENNSLRYYSILSSIFIKYKLFNRLDEIENIIKTYKET